MNANKQVKRIIYKAKNDYQQEFVEELEMEEAKGNLFGVVKRMASKIKDVVVGVGVKDMEGGELTDAGGLERVL